MLSASHDVMLETRSSPTKKNLDEQAGKVTVTDNILQEEHQIIGRSTTPKGQRKEELMLTTIADPSPKHLQKSFTSLERAKVCNVEGVIDELSFAVIAKIRRGIIRFKEENSNKEVRVREPNQEFFAWCIHIMEHMHQTYKQSSILGQHNAMDSLLLPT
jgi:hypothetical protein